jgi:hypothetical protein
MSAALVLDARRARLERRANVMRERLLDTLGALETRRREVVAMGVRVRGLASPLAGAVVGLAVLGAVGALAIRHVVVRRRERGLGYRASQLVARLGAPPRPSLLAELARRATLAVASALIAELAKRHLGPRLLLAAPGTPASPPTPA